MNKIRNIWLSNFSWMSPHFLRQPRWNLEISIFRIFTQTPSQFYYQFIYNFINYSGAQRETELRGPALTCGRRTIPGSAPTNPHMHCSVSHTHTPTVWQCLSHQHTFIILNHFPFLQTHTPLPQHRRRTGPDVHRQETGKPDLNRLILW